MRRRKTAWRPKIGVMIHTDLAKKLFSERDRARLNALGEVKWTDSPVPISVAEAVKILADCDIGVGGWGTPYPCAEIMDGCPKLRLWEHVAGGIFQAVGPHLKGRHLTIASCKPAIADNVAEFTLGMIILGLRKAFESCVSARKGINAAPGNLRALHLSTVGIIGASEMGKRLIEMLRPFRGTMLLYDPFVTPSQAKKMGVTLVKALVDLCACSDVVTLHAPAMESTRKMLGAREFQAMRDDAVFVNTARGMIVDEAALIAELEKGRLFACLDVTDPEPTAPDSPFRNLPNVFLTQHLAGWPALNFGKNAVDDIEAFLRGKSPKYVFTPDMADRAR